MNRPEAHIAQYKKEEADRIKNLLQKYKVIAIADMTNMPSPQLQRLRSSIKNSVLITMSKGRIIKIIFDDLKEDIVGIVKLKEYLHGMPALLLTNDNPFRLSKLLKKSKSSASAKAGQIAPNDIIVPAGPTPFPPGPIIGELGQVGIKAAVVDGKIAIKEDKIIVKEGQQISSQVAGVLTKLGIEPMEIGINLLAALEGNTVFTKKVLDIDETQYLNNIKTAYQSAFNLAFNTAYPTKENIKLLIYKAFRNSNALADSCNILTSENIKRVIAKANFQAESLKSKLNLPEIVKEKEEKVHEESVKSLHQGSHSIQEDEEVAKSILKKLQDEKIAKLEKTKKEDPKFKKEEKAAQDILKKIQDEKIKKEGKNKT